MTGPMCHSLFRARMTEALPCARLCTNQNSRITCQFFQNPLIAFLIWNSLKKTSFPTYATLLSQPGTPEPGIPSFRTQNLELSGILSLPGSCMTSLRRSTHSSKNDRPMNFHEFTQLRDATFNATSFFLHAPVQASLLISSHRPLG